MSDVNLDRIVTPELESIEAYGPETGGLTTLDESSWYVDIGDQPIAFPMRLVFQELGVPFKSKLFDGYELWFVPHRVSLLRRKGQAEVVSFGLEVEYMNGKKTCSVVSLFPAPEFTVYGNVGLDFRGSLTTHGLAEKLTDAAAEIGNLPFGKVGFQFGNDTGAEANVKFRYNATVSTPKISAVGLGSRRCAWEFKKDKDPLFGKTIETWSILALPRFQKNLTYRLRFSVTLRIFLIATWRESDWKEINCVLNRDGLLDYAE